MGGRRRWAAAVVWLACTVAAAGCTQAVAGSATAAPPTVPEAVPVAATTPAGAPAADRTPPPSTEVALEAGVVDDECLLNSDEFAALVGRPVAPPEQTVVRRDDGTTSGSCFVHADDGPPTPLGAINVYGVRPVGPTEFVRASGGRALRGAGRAAAVVMTDAGPVLRVAGDRHLVTIVVMAGEPSDAAWRRAAEAALARLPG